MARIEGATGDIAAAARVMIERASAYSEQVRDLPAGAQALARPRMQDLYDAAWAFESELIHRSGIARRSAD